MSDDHCWSQPSSHQHHHHSLPLVTIVDYYLRHWLLSSTKVVICFLPLSLIVFNHFHTFSASCHWSPVLSMSATELLVAIAITGHHTTSMDACHRYHHCWLSSFIITISPTTIVVVVCHHYQLLSTTSTPPLPVVANHYYWCKAPPNNIHCHRQPPQILLSPLLQENWLMETSHISGKILLVYQTQQYCI